MTEGIFTCIYVLGVAALAFMAFRIWLDRTHPAKPDVDVDLDQLASRVEHMSAEQDTLTNRVNALSTLVNLKRGSSGN